LKPFFIVFKLTFVGFLLTMLQKDLKFKLLLGLFSSFKGLRSDKKEKRVSG